MPLRRLRDFREQTPFGRSRVRGLRREYEMQALDRLRELLGDRIRGLLVAPPRSRQRTCAVARGKPARGLDDLATPIHEIRRPQRAVAAIERDLACLTELEQVALDCEQRGSFHDLASERRRFRTALEATLRHFR